MVAPDTQVQFEGFLNDNRIEHELIIENVERLFTYRVIESRDADDDD